MTATEMPPDLEALLRRYLAANPNIVVDDITAQVATRAALPEQQRLPVETVAAGGVTALIVHDIARLVVAEGGPTVVDVAEFVRGQLLCRAVVAEWFKRNPGADTDEFMATVVDVTAAAESEAV